MLADFTEFFCDTKELLESYEKNDLIAFYFTKLMDHPCHSTFPNLDQLHSLELHVIKNFLSNQKPVDEILKRMLNLI
jgi:hypothetical protein